MATSEELRRDLYEKIATLVAGYPAGTVVAALADNLSQAAGFVTSSPDEAEALLRKLVPDMAHDLRGNWEFIVEAKAQGHAISVVANGGSDGGD